MSGALIEFEWDPDKADLNFAKHRIDFAEAIGIFRGEVLSYASPRTGEPRTVSVGYLGTTAVAVVWTSRGPTLRRIISARRARRNEREAYGSSYPR